MDIAEKQAVTLKVHTKQGEITGQIETVFKDRVHLLFETKRNDMVSLADFAARYTWNERTGAWEGEDDPPPPEYVPPEQTPQHRALEERIVDLEAKVAALGVR